MITIIRKGSLVLLMASLFTTGMMAQPQQFGNGNVRAGNCIYFDNQSCRLELTIPDLTEEQITQLKALRVEQMKATQKYRNQMGEMIAKQRTLMSENPIDQKAMGKLIDDRTALTNKQQKNRVSHRAAINEILTEEQQVYMNQMRPGRGQLSQKGSDNQTFYRHGRHGARGTGRPGGYNRGAGQGW